MQKSELKFLLNEICENLFSSIDNESEKVSKNQVVNLLHETAHIVAEMSEDTVNDKNLAKLLFSNAYKDIVKNSLSSYKHTNNRFEELNLMHKETLDECNRKHIDLPKIIKKFDNIQQNMTAEIKKANEIIFQLSEKVKILETRTKLDGLTKIYNRRALTTYLDKMCKMKVVPDKFHLLIIDVDDFKNINDKYGHIAGDKVLIFLSNTIKKTLRDGDKIFRFGGEEFVVTLNRINDSQCKTIAHRLLKLVAKSKLSYKNNNLSVTISIGLTRLIQGDTPDSLIARADKALYKAKESGKNKMFSESVNGI